MTRTISKKLRKRMTDIFSLEVERQYHLRSMKDDLAKDWIVELMEQVDNLRDEKRQILRAKGNTKFDPVIY